MRRTRTSWSGAAVVWAALLLMGGVSVSKPHDAQAQPAGYTFRSIAVLGDSAPGGGNHINDFEPGVLNNRGDMIYGTDLGTSADPSTFFGEGVFLRRAGEVAEVELARSTGSAPGGGIFDFLLLGQAALNDQGDAAFAFTLVPFDFGEGVPSGLYRYSHVTGKVTPVVVPGTSAPPPAGGTFAGVGFNTSLNNRGDLVFAGKVATGFGFFKADKHNRVTSVASPGDIFPGGSQFDSIGNGGPWINQGGDVAFTAHLAGEEGGLSSIYVKEGGTGKIVPIVHAGDPAPGGGAFRSAYSPVMNNAGDVVFLGDLSSPPDFFAELGVFLYSGGTIQAIARRGDVMPGGGRFVRTSTFTAEQIHINNAGDVAFNALLDTMDGAGTPDTGLYVWSHGALRVVARTGTVIPGVGTVSQLATLVMTGGPPPISLLPSSGASSNDRGQVLFGATLTDGRGVLLLATPTGGEVVRFTGTATGVGLSENQGAMQIVGRLTFQNAIDLGASTVTIASLLDEKGGNGELVQGLPLTLSPMPGSAPGRARFEDRTGPSAAFFDIKEVGTGEFDFRIKLGRAAIARPALCSPTQLTTAFRLDDGRTLLAVSTEQPWTCSGRGDKNLKTP